MFNTKNVYQCTYNSEDIFLKSSIFIFNSGIK